MIHSPKGGLARGKWWKKIRVESWGRSQNWFRKKKKLYMDIHKYTHTHSVYILCSVYIYTHCIFDLYYTTYSLHTVCIHILTVYMYVCSESAAKNMDKHSKIQWMSVEAELLSFKVWNFCWFSLMSGKISWRIPVSPKADRLLYLKKMITRYTTPSPEVFSINPKYQSSIYYFIRSLPHKQGVGDSMILLWEALSYMVNQIPKISILHVNIHGR